MTDESPRWVIQESTLLSYRIWSRYETFMVTAAPRFGDKVSSSISLRVSFCTNTCDISCFSYNSTVKITSRDALKFRDFLFRYLCWQYHCTNLTECKVLRSLIHYYYQHQIRKNKSLNSNTTYDLKRYQPISNAPSVQVAFRLLSVLTNW